MQKKNNYSYTSELLLVSSSIKKRINKKNKNAPQFKFTIPIEWLTKLFIEGGFLNKKNAIKLNNLIKKNQKPEEQLIQWEKELLSLITFIYLADRLDFFDKKVCPTKDHSNPSYPNYNGNGIQYTVFIRYNFDVLPYDGKIEHSKLMRTWNLVDNFIKRLEHDITKQVANRYELNEISDRNKITHYFDNDLSFISKNMNLKKKERGDIDNEIVKIMREIWKKQNLLKHNKKCK